MYKSPSPKKTALNLIASRGSDKLVELVSLLKQNKTCAEIAKSFGVSRQRVHQWKQSFGLGNTKYVPKPEIEELVNQILAKGVLNGQ